MELPTSILETLKIIQNPTSVSDANFNELLTKLATLTTFEKSKDRNTSITGLDATKTSELMDAVQADVACLFVEAARHKYDREKLWNYLQEVKIGESRLERLCDVYSKQINGLIAHMSTIGECLPCIVDANWKLDYCIKTSTQDSVGSCLYHIRLVTKKHGKLDHLQFTCTLHQLQDLIYKLRDAVRHVEKISHA